tara:strand:- start:1111 stop:2187 length:1077 start_codon:yes stop_codon:yes gene_type:complete
MQPKDIRALQEAWGDITEYQLIPQELSETVESAVEELWEECLSEEDLTEDELEVVLEEAAMEYIEEAKVTFGHDTKEPAKRYSDGSRVGATRRLVRKQVGSAIKRGREKAAGAVAGAKIAGSIAKDEAKRAGRKAQHSASKAVDAVKSAPGKAKEKAKKGIKGFIKRQAEKVVNRMSETYTVTNADKKGNTQAYKNYKAGMKKKDGTPMYKAADHMKEEGEIEEGMKPYPAEKVARKREAVKKKEDIHVARGEYDQADKQYKRGVSLAMKTKMKREELEASGLFSEKEIAAIEEAMSSYDRNRKRAAERAAARNAARDAGKTGVVPGVGYVTPRREKETYVDSAGTTRHKSGAKMPKD